MSRKLGIRCPARIGILQKVLSRAPSSPHFCANEVERKLSTCHSDKLLHITQLVAQNSGAVVDRAGLTRGIALHRNERYAKSGLQSELSPPSRGIVRQLGDDGQRLAEHCDSFRHGRAGDCLSARRAEILGGLLDETGRRTMVSKEGRLAFD